MNSGICGWMCPLCGASNAPHMDQCPCEGQKQNKSVLDNVEVKMTEEAKAFFSTHKDLGMQIQNKEHT